MNDGDTHNGPSEQVEAKYPLLVERYCLRPDSGGAGRFRGGLGAEQVVQARHPIRFSSLMERARCKPWGLFGGLSGSGNAVAVHRYGKTDETHFPSAKALNQVLQPGDAYIIRSGGGGGYGSPLRARSRHARARRALRLRHQGGRGEILRRGVRSRIRSTLDSSRHAGAPRQHGAAGPAA